MACVTCPSTPLPPCDCSADQECVRINQSCNECARNICQSLPGVEGPKRDVGPAIGGAIGGALAGIVVVILLWFLWRRNFAGRGGSPLGHHLRGLVKHGASHSRRMSANEKGEPSPQPDRASVAVSKPLDLGTNASRLSKRTSTGPVEGAEELTGRDNPFGDHHASIGTSDWSFRSSQSTQIIPIVYIPPDSASLSVEDGHQRTPLGEKRATQQQQLPAPLTEKNAGGATVARKPSKSKPKAKPMPIRPTRRASLDLVLPHSSPSSPLTPSQLPALPPSPPPTGPTPTDSRFSSSTWATSYAGPRESRFSANLAPIRAGSERASAMSGISDTSSHMSYILDPPQLVTPRSAERINMVGTSTAHRINLSNPHTPITPNMRPSTAPEASTKTTAEDPFSDAASVKAGEQETLSARVVDGPAGKTASLPPPVLTNSLSHHTSLAPRSARNSEIHDFDVTRSSMAPSESDASSRIPSMASLSALDGIPFLSSGESSPATERNSASLFGPLAPPRMPAAMADSRPTSEASLARSSTAWTQGPQSMSFETRPSSTATTDGLSATVSSWGPGLRPDSVATDASGLPERRSGFASVLNDVPFHLAFPGDRDSMATERLSRFDMNDRASMASDVPPLPTTSRAVSMAAPAVAVQLASPEVPPAATFEEEVARPVSSGSAMVPESPIDTMRASTASLAMSAQLAAQLSGDDENTSTSTTTA